MIRIIPRIALFSTLVVTGLALLGVQPGECETITATVVSMDSQGITVQKADGTEARYVLGADLQIPSGVSPGTKVDLTISENLDGTQLVTAIHPGPMQSQTQATASDREELPATASPVWALGAVGFIALLGALLVRRQREKRRPAASGIHFV
jgi:hypothetical protein